MESDEIDAAYDRMVAETSAEHCGECGHTMGAHGFGDLPQPGRCTETGCDCAIYTDAQ